MEEEIKKSLLTVHKVCSIFYLLAALLSLYIAFKLSFGLLEVLLLIATFLFTWKVLGYRAKRHMAKDAKGYIGWSCFCAILYFCLATFLGYQYFTQQIGNRYSIVASVIAGISVGCFCIQVNFWKRKIDIPSSVKLSAVTLIALLFLPSFSPLVLGYSFEVMKSEAVSSAEKIVFGDLPGKLIKNVTIIEKIVVGGEKLEVSIQNLTVIEKGREENYIRGKIISSDENGFVMAFIPTLCLSDLKESVSTSDQLQENPIRYSWKGITFISTQSTPLFVKYDHPDNGPYSNPTYDIPPDEKSGQIISGSNAKAVHIPVHEVNDLKSRADICFDLASALVPVILWLLKVPEAVATKISAGITAGLMLLIKLVGITVVTFIEKVIATEMGDGWWYMYDFGSFWIFKWCTYSIGAWRDRGIPFFYFGSDIDPPKIDYLDTFLIIDTGRGYITVGGFGNNTYGAHSYINSTIYALTFVAYQGNPVEGVQVKFTLISPDGQAIAFDPVTTDKNGIAQIAFQLLPQAPSGIYYLVGEANGLNDTTAFSYKECLLITGYTLDEETVYIDGFYLVAENTTLKFTIANPPSGYYFRRWILDLMYVSYSESVYLTMDDDRFLILSLFTPDLTGDKKVDIRDLGLVCRAFGSYPGESQWNPIADINKDGKVDIKDVAAVARHFGEKYA
jgi:hypothetical protein